MGGYLLRGGVLMDGVAWLLVDTTDVYRGGCACSRIVPSWWPGLGRWVLVARE